MIPFVGLIEVMSDWICSVCKHNKTNFSLVGFDDYLSCEIVIYSILFLLYCIAHYILSSYLSL